MQAAGPPIFHNNQKHNSLTDVKTRNTQICLIIPYDPSMYLRLGYWHGTPAPPKLPTIYLTVAFADAIALWNASVRNKASLKVLNAWQWMSWNHRFRSWMSTLPKKIVQQYRTVPSSFRTEKNSGNAWKQRFNQYFLVNQNGAPSELSS